MPVEHWSITQDQRGIIYIGNQWRILEFDGTTRQLIKSPKNTGALSLDFDNNGPIWAGFENDFGHLSTDSIGNSRFVSI